MKRIYKYPLEMTDAQTIELPVGAQILSVQTQDQGRMFKDVRACIWAVVDPLAARQKRMVSMVGTGVPFGDGLALFDFLGTVQFEEGRLVLHVFISKEQP